MAADRRHNKNLFHLLEGPQMLYIRLMIKVTGSVHMKYIQKNLLNNVLLVQYEFSNGTIRSFHVTYEKKFKTSGSSVLFL